MDTKLNKYHFDQLFASTIKLLHLGGGSCFIGDVNQGFSGLLRECYETGILIMILENFTIMGIQGIGCILWDCVLLLKYNTLLFIIWFATFK
jgi:hypothetical protein